MPRELAEWIGKTDDAKIPPRVRDRVFERHGKTCHICQLPIKPIERWDADHVIALINGGENRETNLAPAHKHCHVGKTAIDVKTKAKVARVRQKNSFAVREPSKLKSAGFQKTEKALRRQDKPSLQPRKLYGERT